MVSRAVQRLVDEFQPRQVYLFGSHAWGQVDDDSDVDLMVVVEEMSASPARMACRAYACLRGLHFAKDILVRSAGSFRRNTSESATLEAQVAKRGKLLYG